MSGAIYVVWADGLGTPHNKIVMSKSCPEHGRFQTLIASDAEIYKDAQNRSFKHRAEYTEGRKTRNSRDQRAIANRSKHGRAQDEAAWKSFGTLDDAKVDAMFAAARLPLDGHAPVAAGGVGAKTFYLGGSSDASIINEIRGVIQNSTSATSLASSAPRCRPSASAWPTSSMNATSHAATST